MAARAAHVQTVDGHRRRLAEELAEADLAVMVATDSSGATAAAEIGRASAERGIMTAGVVIDAGQAHAVLGALRPFARVLLVTQDEQDVAEVLAALRA